MTLQLMMMHHQAKVGYKRLSSSNDIQTKPGHVHQGIHGHSDSSMLPPPPLHYRGYENSQRQGICALYIT